MLVVVDHTIDIVGISVKYPLVTDYGTEADVQKSLPMKNNQSIRGVLFPLFIIRVFKQDFFSIYVQLFK